MAERLPTWRHSVAFALAGAAALFFIFSCGSANAQNFSGRYDGMGGAAGLAMVLSQDEAEMHGRIAAGGKDVYLMSGQVAGKAVSGHLTGPRAHADFKLEWQPGEIIFTLTPLLSDGSENHAASKLYAFRRGKAAMSALADYHPEPPNRGESVEITRFLENYRSWSPREVAIGYAGLSDWDRSLIDDYDHLQADIMNRLCQGAAPRASLMSATTHEDVDCDALTSLIDKAKATHRIAGFDAEADNQRSALYSVVACMHNLYAGDKCAGLSTAPERAGETWQSAGNIFSGMSGYGAQSGALVDEMLDADPNYALTGAQQPDQNKALAPALSSLDQQANADHSAGPRKPASLRTPKPQQRPSVVAGGRDLENQKVDDSLLASTDQSAEFKPHEADPSLQSGFGFDLRPSSGGSEEPHALFAGPGASAPNEGTALRGSGLVPAPRPKPRPSG